MRLALSGAALAIVAAGVYWINASGEQAEPAAQSTSTGIAMVDLVLPESLSPTAQIGKTAFLAKCAACHGANAAGQQGVAPPLVHIIYEPSHHGDESFQRAAALGVRAHHWKFGDMPPVEGLTRGDVKTIVAYIRELQRNNGIN